MTRWGTLVVVGLLLVALGAAGGAVAREHDQDVERVERAQEQRAKARAVARARAEARARARAAARGGSPVLRELRRNARQRSRYRFAVRAGAEFVTTRDGRSFAITWRTRSRPRGTIVTLHGFKSTALDDFARWHKYARRNNLALVAFQWRRGLRSTAPKYGEGAIYANVARLLSSRRIRRGTVLLHGWSTAAIRAYGVTALDRRRGRWFAASVANAGAPDAVATRRSGRVFRGSRWIMFCAGRDPNPNYSGCPAMRRAARFVERNGGRILRFIRDPRAGHSGFLGRSRNVTAALRVFNSLLPNP